MFIKNPPHGSYCGCVVDEHDRKIIPVPKAKTKDNTGSGGGSAFVGAILGTKGSGKTVLMRNCLTHIWRGTFDLILVISPTWGQQEEIWRGTIGDEAHAGPGIDGSKGIVIFDRLHVAHLEAIKNLHMKKLEANPPRVFNSLLIIDDSGFFLRDHSDEARLLDEFVLTCRHYNCSLIWSSQCLTQLSPSLRKNLNWMVSFPQNNSRELILMHSEWQPFETEDFLQFKSFMRSIPEYNYVCLEINSGVVHRSDILQQK